MSFVVHINPDWSIEFLNKATYTGKTMYRKEVEHRLTIGAICECGDCVNCLVYRLVVTQFITTDRRQHEKEKDT